MDYTSVAPSIFARWPNMELNFGLASRTAWRVTSNILRPPTLSNNVLPKHRGAVSAANEGSSKVVPQADISQTVTSGAILEKKPEHFQCSLCSHAGFCSQTGFSASLTALAGTNANFFDAAICIVAPFAGLRPSRAGRS